MLPLPSVSMCVYVCMCACARVCACVCVCLLGVLGVLHKKLARPYETGIFFIKFAMLIKCFTEQVRTETLTSPAHFPSDHSAGLYFVFGAQ